MITVKDIHKSYTKDTETIKGVSFEIGKGTIFGHRLFFNPAVSGMNLPFAGFIMLGFGLAIYNMVAKSSAK